jgi:hypothetical protein
MFRSDPAEGILLLAPSLLLMTFSVLESVIWGSMGSGSRREMGWRDMGDEAEAYRFRIEFREITRARAPLRARFSAGAGQRLSISIPMMADNLDNLGTLSYGARTGTGPRSNELKQRL